MNPAAPVTRTRIVAERSREPARLVNLTGPADRETTDPGVGRWCIRLVGLWVVAAPMHARAGDSDFRLNGTQNGQGILFTCDGGTGNATCAPNQDAYLDFTTQLGFVLAPRLASPAETLGYAGFHVSGVWSGSFVSGDEPYWANTEGAQAGGAAPSFLQTLQLDIRKGLPLSFEVGVNLTWLVDSELFTPGVEVRWAIQEGYAYLPDFAVRAAINHLVGNRDLRLTTLALDTVLSKSFGVAGTVNLAPYAGWSLIMIASSSRVIDPTPLDDTDLQNNFSFKSRGLGDRIDHRLLAGLRALYGALNVSVQAELQMLPDYATGGSNVVTLTTKLGLDY